MARRKRATVNATTTLLLLGLLSGRLLLVQGQVDQANARAIDGFSNAVVQAGSTVAQAICTPLSRADTITLYDATTGQTLQSTCEVTGKIEEFIRGIPEDLKSAAEVFQTQINNTAGFVQYMESTLKGIVGNVSAQLDVIHPNKKPINVNGVFDRLVQVIEEKKTSDPPCIDAQEYAGADIPTQCVGPKFDLVIDGGSCEEDIVTGIITCTQPSVTLTKTPGACNIKYTSPTVIQDRYCTMSTTYGNSTSGTFKHPAEIFNLQKLLTVPNPFNLDLSLYTATASASASPVAKPPENANRPLPPSSAPEPVPPPKAAPPPVPVPAPAPVPAPGPAPILAPVPAPGPKVAPAPGPASRPQPSATEAPKSAPFAEAAPGLPGQSPYPHEEPQKKAADEALAAQQNNFAHEEPQKKAADEALGAQQNDFAHEQDQKKAADDALAQQQAAGNTQRAAEAAERKATDTEQSAEGLTGQILAATAPAAVVLSALGQAPVVAEGPGAVAIDGLISELAKSPTVQQIYG